MRLLLFFACYLATVQAAAANYILPGGPLPPGCSLSGSDIICSGLNLDWGDKISVTEPNLTLEINGDANFQNAKVNQGGASSALTIRIVGGNFISDTGFSANANLIGDGEIQLAFQSDFNGDIEGERISVGGQTEINGSLVAEEDITTGSGTSVTGSINAQNVNLGSSNTVVGDISTDEEIETGSNTQITGNLMAENIRLGSNNEINGDLTAEEEIETGSGTSVSGSLTAEEIDIASSNVLGGPINAAKEFKTDSGTQINGPIYAEEIELGSANTVNGDLSADKIEIEASNGRINGNITALDKLEIGSGGQVVGNISAGEVELKDSNVLVQGNIEAQDQVEIGWGGRVTGSVTAPHITNNGTIEGPAYCDTSGGASAPLCMESADLHHYQLSHTGTALTCLNYQVTVTACENADCSAQYSFTGSIDIAESGSGFSAITANFTNSSQTTVNLSIPTTGTYTLTTANPTGELPDNPHQCSGGSGDGCRVDAVDTTLRFSNEADRIAGQDFQLGLQAIRTDNNTGACAAALNGSHSVDFTLECLSPGSCSDPGAYPQAELTLNSTRVTTGTSVNVSFDNNGSASLALNYGDAGDIRLSAQTQSNQTGATLTGNSQSFNVRPEQLQLSHNAATLQRAGDDFTLTIEALGAHSQVTPNYQPGDIQIQFERTAPVAGVEGVLTFDTEQLTSQTPAGFEDIDDNALNFSAGASSTTPYITEVGEFSLRVMDVNYSDYSISSQSLSLGRFIPAYFDVTAEEPELLDTCTELTPIFSYVGEAIGFNEDNELQPTIRIEARNMQNQITSNYADSFWRLGGWDIPNQMSYSDSNYEPAETLTANTNNQVLTQLELDTYDGIGFYRIDDATVTYNKGLTALAPFTPALDINISEAALTDSDGVCFRDSPTDPCQEFRISNISGANLRYGRARLANAYGQETEVLPVPLQLEYYNGTSWVLNTDDNCSVYNADDLQLTTTLTTSASGTGTVTGGRPLVPMLGFMLEAAGETGEVELLWQNLPDWLQFDWQGDGTALSEPRAVATFGQYRGNDRIIHWREVFE